MEDDQDTQTYANESATSSSIGTRLTQWRTRPVRGCVYFIQSDEAIKIGYSASPEMRLGELQVGSHQTLEIIGLMEGTIITERKLQKRFRHLHIRGEWFQAATELLDYIDRVAIRVEPPPPLQPPVSAESRQAIANLVNLRSAHGADTPMGYACSNLAEQIQNMAGYERPTWASHECQTLPWVMKRQMVRLEELRALSN